MANPRNDVRHINARVKDETYKHDNTIVYDKTKPFNSLQAGLAVTMTGEVAKTVSLVGDGEHVAGRLQLVEGDGNCVVRVMGNVELPAGAAAALTPGAPIVGALGAASAEGYIKSSDNSTAALAGAARGRIIDGTTDTTKVVVALDD